MALLALSAEEQRALTDALVLVNTVLVIWAHRRMSNSNRDHKHNLPSEGRSQRPRRRRTHKQR